MTATQEPALFLRALKGAPMSVFMALLFHRGCSLGTNDLVGLTGYSKSSITLALQALATLGLVQNHGRYRAWALTAQARQLALGDPEAPVLPPTARPAEPRNPGLEAQNSGLEAQDLYLPSSSSGRGSDPFSSERETTPPTTTEPEAESQNLRLPEPWYRLALGLTESCGIPPQRARKGAREAMESGRHPGQCLYYALCWQAYCIQQNLAHPGTFRAIPFAVLARVQDGTPPPAFDPPEHGTLACEIQEAWDWWHGLDAYTEELPY